MKRNLLLLLSLAVIDGPIFAMQNDSESCAKYLHQKYQAPQELEALLDTAYEQNEAFRECIESRKNRVCKCPYNLPCYIKTIYGYNMARLKNLDKLKKMFEQENLDELMLPEKYLWRDIYLVAEELAPEKNSHDECTLDGITKKQLAQLLTLSQKGGFGDFIGWSYQGTNVYHSKDLPGKKFWHKDYKSPEQATSQKIAIIDTKRFSFKDIGSPDQLWKFIARRKDQECSWEQLKAAANDIQSLGYDTFWNKWEHCFKEKI